MAAIHIVSNQRIYRVLDPDLLEPGPTDQSRRFIAASALLHELVQRSPSEPISALTMATAYMGLGETERVLEPIY